MKQSTLVAVLFDSAATFRSGLPEKLAFVLLNVLDLALSACAASTGFTELNPFFRHILLSPWQLLSLKVAIPVLIAYLMPRRLLLPAILLLALVVGWDVKELVAGLI